jgi:ABC-2 type transport system permease protein
MNLKRLTAVARKEFIHVMRDWRSLYLSLAIPVILIMLFGYALTLDLRNVPTVVFDQSRTAQSRELLSLYQGSPYFSMVGYYDDYASVQLALERGDALVAIVVPSDFAGRINARKSVAVQILCDGSDANTSRLAMGYASSVGMIYSSSVTAKMMRFMGQADLKPPVEMVSRSWYNPDLRSQNVIIPGIIAIVMVVIAAMLTSVTIAR